MTPIYDALYAEMFGDDSPIYDELVAAATPAPEEAAPMVDANWLIQLSRMRAKASPADGYVVMDGITFVQLLKDAGY